MNKKISMNIIATLIIITSAKKAAGFEFENGTSAPLRIAPSVGGTSTTLAIAPGARKTTQYLNPNLSLTELTITSEAGNLLIDNIGIIDCYNCNYRQPELKNKKKFRVTKGNKNPGNFIVKSLD